MSSNNGLPRAASKTLVKLRISSHKLRIEAGRYDISKIQLGPIPMLRSDWLSYYWAPRLFYSLLAAKSARFLAVKKD